MFPDFHYLIEYLFGIDAPEWLGVFKTFGLFVALGFLTAAYVLVQDLKRKERLGLMTPVFQTIEVGRPASANDLLWAGLIGFLLGHKAGGFYGHWEEISPNPMGYLFSLQGNFIAGVLGALLMAYLKYAEKKKERLPRPEQRKVAVYPHQRITEYIVGVVHGKQPVGRPSRCRYEQVGDPFYAPKLHDRPLQIVGVLVQRLDEFARGGLPQGAIQFGDKGAVENAPVAIPGKEAAKASYAIGKHERRCKRISQVLHRDLVFPGKPGYSDSCRDQAPIECEP